MIGFSYHSTEYLANTIFNYDRPYGWSIQRSDIDSEWKPWLQTWSGQKFGAVPLWPFIVAGIPATIVLFYRDRRIPPGHCGHCRYNLTGNVSGRCPECGAEIVPS